MKRKPKDPRKLLLRIAHDADERAFRELFDAYFPGLIAFANYHVRNTNACEEIVSDIFIGLWDRKEKLPEIKHLDQYLYTSVRNRCMNYLRDSKRRNHVWLVEECPVQIEADHPEALFTSGELKKVLIETIEKLPPKCRLVFRMVREEGMKYKEVAEALDISVKTVDVQVGRAVARIYKAIKAFNADSAGPSTLHISSKKQSG